MQKSLRCKDSRLGFGILILFGISLARKSAAEQLEVRHGARVGFSGIFNEPLSLRVKQGVITAVGVFVDFAVSYAFKSSGTSQSLTKTADAGEHIPLFLGQNRPDQKIFALVCRHLLQAGPGSPMVRDTELWSENVLWPFHPSLTAP